MVGDDCLPETGQKANGSISVKSCFTCVEDNTLLAHTSFNTISQCYGFPRVCGDTV